MKQRHSPLPSSPAAGILGGLQQRRHNLAANRQGQAKTAEAAQDMKDYNFAQKMNSPQMNEGGIRRAESRLDQLGSRIEKSSDAVKRKPNQDSKRCASKQPR